MILINFGWLFVDCNGFWWILICFCGFGWIVVDSNSFFVDLCACVDCLWVDCLWVLVDVGGICRILVDLKWIWMDCWWILVSFNCFLIDFNGFGWILIDFLYFVIGFLSIFVNGELILIYFDIFCLIMVDSSGLWINSNGFLMDFGGFGKMFDGCGWLLLDSCCFFVDFSELWRDVARVR